MLAHDVINLLYIYIYILFDGEKMKLLTAKDLNLLSGIFLMGELSKFLAVG